MATTSISAFDLRSRSRKALRASPFPSLYDRWRFHQFQCIWHAWICVSDNVFHRLWRCASQDGNTCWSCELSFPDEFRWLFVPMLWWFWIWDGVKTAVLPQREHDNEDNKYGEDPPQNKPSCFHREAPEYVLSGSDAYWQNNENIWDRENPSVLDTESLSFRILKRMVLKSNNSLCMVCKTGQYYVPPYLVCKLKHRAWCDPLPLFSQSFPIFFGKHQHSILTGSRSCQVSNGRIGSRATGYAGLELDCTGVPDISFLFFTQNAEEPILPWYMFHNCPCFTSSVPPV